MMRNKERARKIEREKKCGKIERERESEREKEREIQMEETEIQYLTGKKSAENIPFRFLRERERERKIWFLIY